MGRSMLNFAELTLTASAPMEDLISAINQLVKDIADRNDVINE